MEKEVYDIPLREDYICVDPERGLFLFDYINRLLSNEERSEFEVHLLICFHCQEELADWMLLYGTGDAQLTEHECTPRAMDASAGHGVADSANAKTALRAMKVGGGFD